MSKEHHITHTMVPLSFEYKYRVGQSLERYLDALGDKKILAMKCPNCSRVVVPPRSFCGACNTQMGDLTEVGPEGTLENYTVAHVIIEGGEVKPASEPFVIGQIKLDGADSLLTAKVKADAGALSKGVRVRAVFVDEPKGTVHDLEHFELIG